MVTAIRAEGVYKVFGAHPERGVERLEAGEDREALRADGLTAAVIDASFEVQDGEIFVVMGLSGSGKSTLIRMVNGLLSTTAGTMEVQGDDISKLSSEDLRRVRREKVSMVFQSFALLPHRTVGENAAYGLEIQGVNKAEREKTAAWALGQVGLGEWGGVLPSQLSGGMQQRVGLARAIAAGTDILLMDEAFSALDPLIRRDMQDQLLEVQHNLNKTILFISHDLNEAMKLGDRIAMMRDGRIEQIGTAEQLLAHPANPYVATFTEDVDRSRVLTAQTIAKRPADVLSPGQGLEDAERIVTATNAPWLLALNADGSPMGLLWADDIAKARTARTKNLPVDGEALPIVNSSTRIADLCGVSAAHRAPLAVVDDNGRFVGAISQADLLAAVSHPTHHRQAPSEGELA